MNEHKSVASGFCSSVIAWEYYDGPTVGVGVRLRDCSQFFFSMVAWDHEAWERVFAVTTIGEQTAAPFRHELAKIESVKVPLWLPTSAANTPKTSSAWAALLAEAHQSKGWSLVESHDLLHASNEVTVPRQLVKTLSQLVRAKAVLEMRTAPLLPPFLEELARYPASDVK